MTLSWNKVESVTFDEKEIISYESDGKTIKQTSKEIIKKKFNTFNETMKINLKFQQHMQIIDHSLETKIINSNIEHISKKYQGFYEKYANIILEYDNVMQKKYILTFLLYAVCITYWPKST